MTKRTDNAITEAMIFAIIALFWLVVVFAAPAHAQAPVRANEVRALASSGPGAVLMQGCKTSKAACGQFTRLVACALKDAGFGLLTKNPGENQFEGYAVDAIIYRETNQVVDIISANESPNAAPGWSEVPRRSGNNFAPAIGCSVTPPPDPPVDPPVSDAVTHAELKAAVDALSARIAALEAGSGSGSGEQLDTTKKILALLEKAAARLGIQ